MAKKFGGIELGGVLGGYGIVNIPANKLPQEVASAMGAANSTPHLGATYNPIWYVGKQMVNGTNYLFIAEDIRTTKNKDKFIVGLVVNVPPGEHATQGEGAKVVRIIESEELDSEVQTAFEVAEKGLTGVGYKPVMYVGKKTSVLGVNHYIVCEGKILYPNAQPFAAIMCVNILGKESALVGVAPISPNAPEGICGYSFTW